nr:putative reverse transcriptase [Tanacetum cinerariifolium]
NSNPSTSNGTPLILDDKTKRFLAKTIAVLNKRSQLNHSRMAKIEFPKFSGDDVKGWEVYKKSILARFGNVYEDHVSELKNLKYETTARECEDAFDSLLSRVEISKDHDISLFMGGLPTEIEMGVRMFKPQTLADAYCLTNLQEATLNAVKMKGRSAFVLNQSSQTMEDHALHLKTVLEIMRHHQLYAKRSKCVFGTDNVEYLGHVISAKGVATDLEKVKAMNEWPVPINLKQLKGFLELTGYYRRFIQGYATISIPLTQLLKKNSFFWTDESQTAFLKLKQAMVNAPVLRLSDFSKRIYTGNKCFGSWARCSVTSGGSSNSFSK